MSSSFVPLFARTKIFIHNFSNSSKRIDIELLSMSKQAACRLVWVCYCLFAHVNVAAIDVLVYIRRI